jgi:cobalt/nickel transport system permease protein
LLSPATSIVTSFAGAGGVAFALRRLERSSPARTIVLTGVMAAFVFAAQMVNFPVALGVSGHLLGGVLAAVVLGPGAAAIALTSVLVVQCLIYGDGGLSALGANVLNMGLVGVLGGWAIYVPIRRWLGGRRGILIGAMLAAWFSVILAAGSVAIELAVSSRIQDFPRLLGWMILVHAAIGLGEALITGLVLRGVLQVRPDLVHEGGEELRAGAYSPESQPLRMGQIAFGGLALALAVSVFLAPLASDFDDGLEWVLGQLDLTANLTPGVVQPPIPDYEIPGMPTTLGLATSVAGILGTLVVFISALGLARVFVRTPVGRASEGPQSYAA